MYIVLLYVHLEIMNVHTYVQMGLMDVHIYVHIEIIKCNIDNLLMLHFLLPGLKCNIYNYWM